MSVAGHWEAVALRCRTATEPDRDIDRCILSLIPDGLLNMSIWAPTASIDSITALIGQELPGWEIVSRLFADSSPKPAFASTFIRGGGTKDSHAVYAATEALARCAVFCQAMAAKA